MIYQALLWRALFFVHAHLDSRVGYGGKWALVVRRKQQASEFVLIRGYTIKQLNTLIVTPIPIVLRPKLTKQCLYDLSGAIMESALFCTRSLRQSGRLWWKMGEQYSRTGLIAVQWKSTISLKLKLNQKKKIRTLICFPNSFI